MCVASSENPAYLLNLLSQRDEVHGIPDSVGVIRAHQLQSTWIAVGFHQCD